jgi:hypothetical protein
MKKHYNEKAKEFTKKKGKIKLVKNQNRNIFVNKQKN